MLENADYAESDYSTSVIRSSKMTKRHTPLAMLDERASTLSVRTLRQGDSPLLIPARRGSADTSAVQSFMTARTHRGDPSMALATIASINSGAIEPVPICHRFTLVKNGTRRPNSVTAAAQQAVAGSSGHAHQHVSSYPSLLPPAVMLSNALAKCWVCGKRIGWKPFMDCDDCPYKLTLLVRNSLLPHVKILPSHNLEVRVGSSVQPVLSPHNVSRRNSKATDVGDQREISAAAAALRRASLNDSGDEPASPQMGKTKAKKKLFGGSAVIRVPSRPNLIDLFALPLHSTSVGTFSDFAPALSIAQYTPA